VKNAPEKKEDLEKKFGDLWLKSCSLI
jgi:hypothetical protein